jgi:hypothetical protein
MSKYFFVGGTPHLSASGGAMQPNRVRMSLTYLAYWLALTVWMLYTVRSSVLLYGNKQGHAKAQGTPAVAHTPAETSSPAEDKPEQDASPCDLQDQFNSAASGDTGGATQPAQPMGERTKSLEVTKVC